MQSKQVRFGRGFKVLLENSKAQVAQMTIGRARRVALKRGTLLLVEKGNLHEIRNVGTTPLKTLNFYVPPAYDIAGDERAAGRKKRT